MIFALALAARSFFAILILFVLTRFMGKRQIAQLSFFDYVAGITIGSVAANFAVNLNIKYYDVILSMVIFALVPILISFLTLKSLRMRKLLSGAPLILYHSGSFILSHMRSSRMNINDILEECRLNGVFNLDDVQTLILETNGKISILKKSAKLPLTPQDLNINITQKDIEAEFIIDGTVIRKHLDALGLSEEWLLDELKKQNIDDISDVLLCTFRSDATLFVCKKTQGMGSGNVLL
jgi:uncharacterized membrane protein YcaP (DUF421 family)